MKSVLLALLFLSQTALSEEYKIPSLKGCEDLTYTVQSVNGEAFQGDLSLAFAAIDTLNLFSTCSREIVTISDADIQCHQYRGYLEVCAVTSDFGKFLIVGDHVDGASVHVLPKSSIETLKFSGHDTFSLPNPSSCYSELLMLDSDQAGSRDHRNIWIENGLGFRDMRQASAAALRKLSSALNLSCEMPLENAPIFTADCVLLNGIQSCFIPAESGYFITARNELRTLAVGFYRWD